MIRLSYVFLGAALSLGLCGTVSAAPTATGVASEWTQLLNNAQLKSIVAVEGQQLGIQGETLAAQLEQVRIELETYQQLMRNVERLPDIYKQEAMASVSELRDIMEQVGALAQDGRAVDAFLRSGLIEDPLFDQAGVDEAQLTERYDDWTTQFQGSMAAALSKAGLSLADVETEAALVDTISNRMGSEAGYMQAMQVANELAASTSRSMVDLRQLTATQAELASVAWGRTFAEQDAEEAKERAFQRDLELSRDALDNAPAGRSLYDIFGIGQ